MCRSRIPGQSSHWWSGSDQSIIIGRQKRHALDLQLDHPRVAQALIKFPVQAWATVGTPVVSSIPARCGTHGCIRAIRQRRRYLAPLNVKGLHDIMNFNEGARGGDGAVCFRERDGIGEEKSILVIMAAAGGRGDQDKLGVLRPAAVGILEAGGVQEGCGEAVGGAGDRRDKGR